MSLGAHRFFADALRSVAEELLAARELVPPEAIVARVKSRLWAVDRARKDQGGR